MKDGIRRDKLREYGAIIVKEPIVITENIITSWSPVRR
jgi:hypothetical protein